MTSPSPASVRHLLGRGMLTWPRGERVSDRYGRVGLQRGDDPQVASGVLPARDVALHCDVPQGTRARLVAQVLEVRESDHIGDLFRGLFPTTPLVDDVFVLGEGRVVYSEMDGWQLVGLMPEDDRPNDWLDPARLYRVHSQTVELVLEYSNEETT